MIVILSAIAAIASVIGAIFATWRWDYARKAFDLQKKQIYIQILMLAEYREYWNMPKMAYVKKKDYINKDTNIDDEIEHIIRGLEGVFK